MTYRTNELAFELPEGLKDRSVNVFLVTDEGPSEFSLVISRVPLKEGQTLADCVSMQLREMQARMPSFALLESGERRVAGAPAAFLDFIWKAEGGLMNQRQVSFAAGAPGRRMVLMLTGTCKDRFTPQWGEAFEATVNSLKIEQS